MIWSVEACLRRAEEAESLARTVTYEKDRQRLREEAQGWREHAARMEAHADNWRDPAPVSRLRALGAWLCGR
jgi:hypothetical protein